MRESLGEFEQLVPLAVVEIGDDVYGVPIVVLKGCATYLETALKGLDYLLQRRPGRGLRYEGRLSCQDTPNRSWSQPNLRLKP